MPHDWADKIAQQLLSRGLIPEGICLILGAADTGKTSLATALAKQLVGSRTIGIIDADIGQSHIGPPATVSWAPLYVFSYGKFPGGTAILAVFFTPKDALWRGFKPALY